MPRIRKEPNRYWSKEEKLRIINLVLNDGLSTEQAAKQEDISGGMLRNWIKQYLGMQHFSVAFNMDNLFRISTIKQERGIAYPFSRRFSFSLSAIF